MRTFLEAIKSATESMDILFYLPVGADISSNKVTETQENLARFWGIDAQVNFALMPDNPKSPWAYYLSPIASFFKHPDYRPASGIAQVLAFEKCLERNPDAIFIYQLNAACPVILTHKKLPPVFFDLNDIEHIKFFRDLNRPPFWLGKLFYYLQIPALMWGERRAIRLAKKTFVCSGPDRAYLSRLFGTSKVVSVPNSVEIPKLELTNINSKTLLFIGSYTYGPNIAAAELLIDKIWPLVRRRVPEARLQIAGNGPERIPSFKARPQGVEFSGFLPMLDETYRNTQIVCCPILTGGGTRLKIIEAAAYGKPVVSTKLGAEGLEFEEGSEIILRDGATDFAEACIELLKDPTKCGEIGRRAREKAATIYDRGQIVTTIATHLNDDSPPY